MMDLFKLHAVIIIWSQSGLVAIMYFVKDQGATVKQRKEGNSFRGFH